MTKLYELTYLVSPDFSKENLKEISQKINNFIVQENGILEREIEPVKLMLAYPVKKKREAFLITLIFQISPDNLEKLEKKVKDESQILRYIILIVRQPKKIRKRGLRGFSKEKTFLEEKTSKSVIKLPKTPKIELKEIDKKIEEILNE